MHNGQGTRDDPSAMRVEDMITVELPDDGHVDRDYLHLVLRDPYTYLPPRRNRPRSPGAGMPGERESDLVRRAKVLGLITASTLLVCALIACAVLAQHPTRRSVAEDSTASLTGIAALGVLNTHRGTAGGTAAPQTVTAGPSSPSENQHSRPSTAHETTSIPVPERTSAPPEPATTSEPATSPASDTRRSRDNRAVQRSTRASSGSAAITTENESRKFEVVRELYRRVAHDPGSATALLDLGLLDNQLHTLLTTWRSLEDVRLLRLNERPDGSVLAVVTMRRSDGRSLRITQVIEFAEGAVINHVQLLSAQHI